MCKSIWSCLTLCNHMDPSPPGSSAGFSSKNLMGFSRQEYWSGLPCPPPGALPDPGIKPESLASPALAAGSLPLAPPGKLLVSVVHSFLLLSLIPWHGWMYYDLFNHSPIEEHLGCLSFGEIYFTISFSILKFMYLLFWNRQFFLHFSFFCFYF